MTAIAPLWFSPARPEHARPMTRQVSQALQFDDLATQVETDTGVRVDELVGTSRMPVVSRARHELMARLRAANWSLHQIAEYLRRDHTTVMYGLKQHAKRQARAKVQAG